MIDLDGWSVQTYRWVDIYTRTTIMDGKRVTQWKFWVDGKKYSEFHLHPDGGFDENRGCKALQAVDNILSEAAA